MGIRARFLAGGVAVAAVLSASSFASPVVAAPAAAAVVVAAYPHDFADASILTVGGTYWAYATGTGSHNLQLISSPDLRHWSAVHDPLPTLPAWAAAGHTWAPAVLRRGSLYVLYYAVASAATGRECISDAVATVPQGPFVDRSSGPLICQVAQGGSIDPSPFVDASGVPYLLWKSDDNAIGRPSHLYAQQLSANGRSVVGPANVLLTESQAWQAPTIEGPAMVANGGLYYLFYAANNWNSADSGIGYAICTAVLGPCLNASGNAPWLGSRGMVRGPQAPSVFTAADGTTRLAYAAWPGQIGYVAAGMRSLWIGTLSFGLGGPQLG